MSYIKTKYYQTDQYSPALRIKRASFSKKILELLLLGKILVNFDESSFDRTNFTNKSWVAKGTRNLQIQHHI
jgi:hypothetical protein